MYKVKNCPNDDFPTIYIPFPATSSIAT